MLHRLYSCSRPIQATTKLSADGAQAAGGEHAADVPEPAIERCAGSEAVIDEVLDGGVRGGCEQRALRVSQGCHRPADVDACLRRGDRREAVLPARQADIAGQLIAQTLAVPAAGIEGEKATVPHLALARRAGGKTRRVVAQDSAGEGAQCPAARTKAGSRRIRSASSSWRRSSRSTRAAPTLRAKRAAARSASSNRSERSR